MSRIKTFAVSGPSRFTPQNTKYFKPGCTLAQQLYFAGLVDNKHLLKVRSCQNIFKCICSQLPGFLTLGNFPDTLSHRFCISAVQPCNPAFKILHRYPVSCASVSVKSVSEILCADQKLRQSINSPRVDFFDSRQAVRFSPHSFHYAHTFEQRRRYFNNIHCIFVERKMNARMIGS